MLSRVERNRLAQHLSSLRPNFARASNSEITSWLQMVDDYASDPEVLAGDPRYFFTAACGAEAAY